MPSILDILKMGFLGYLSYDFVQNLRTTRTRRLFKVTFGYDQRKLILFAFENLPILALVIGIGSLLYAIPGPLIPIASFKVPLFQASWLQFLAPPGHPEAGGNLVVAGAIKFPWIGVAFAILLFLNLPRLARYEEDAFRRGTKDWKDGAWRSLKFGLLHCLVGVPLGFGLALGLGGLWFTYHYFRGGVRQSTAVHTLYNATLLLSVAGYMAITAVFAPHESATAVNAGPSPTRATKPDRPPNP